MEEKIFSPSLMCMDISKMKEQFAVLDKYIDLYHVDIMDGHFCKNITLSPDLIAAFRKFSDKDFDVHLMTTDPCDWIEMVAKAGATIISPHAETINTDAFRVMNLIKSLGCKCGVVLNPATPLSYVEPYLHRIDLLTIMTVDVGFAGQPFIEEMLEKIKEAKRLREEKGYQYKIQIDGSCNKKTFKQLNEAGADIFVVGNSGLFNLDEDLDRAYHKMKIEFNEETGLNV